MNGRFIFKNVDPRDRKPLRAVLTRLPVIARPSLVFPYSECFCEPADESHITRKQAYKNLEFEVYTPFVFDEKNNDYKIYPIKTLICEGVQMYDIRKTLGSQFQVIEAWHDFQIILLTEYGGKTYEIGLFTRGIDSNSAK